MLNEIMFDTNDFQDTFFLEMVVTLKITEFLKC